MYCRSRPQYRSDLGWILGVAFLGTLTRSARPAQGFTYVRCCSAPPASSPHGLTAPGRIVSRRPTCVQLPSACGCFQLAPQRTCTSNPGSMPGTRCSLRSHRLRRLKPLTLTLSPAVHSAMSSMLHCCTSDLKRREVTYVDKTRTVDLSECNAGDQIRQEVSHRPAQSSADGAVGGHVDGAARTDRRRGR